MILICDNENNCLDRGKMQKTDNENKIMRVLTALGIIFIVCGHLSCEVFTLWELFPYYSFHVFIFLFVSGYFYNASAEEKPGKYILHKAKSLLLPYFICNFFYGLLSTHLDYQGIYVGNGISLWNLFIEPFLGGHQFGLNSPAWFVPALFLILVINLLGRKVLGGIIGYAIKCFPASQASNKSDFAERIIDIIMLLASLVLGIITIWLAIGGHVYDYLKTPGRLLIMLPGLQFGRIYGKYLEGAFEKIRIKAGEITYYGTFFFIILTAQFYLFKHFGNLPFGVVWCSNFANGPVIPYVTVITGISFWLLISRLLAAVMDKTNCFNWLLWVGRGSREIMTHHFFVLLVVNLICMELQERLGINLGFDWESFAHDYTYQCLYAGYIGTRIINVFLCVSIPTCIDVLFRCKIKKKN